MMERRSRIISFMRTAVAILTMAVSLLALPAPADASTTPPSRAEVRGAALGSDGPQSQVADALDWAREHSVPVSHAYDSRSHLGRASATFNGCRKTPRATSDVLLNSSNQLQSKFKHAADFGVTGNYSRANAAKFSAALNQHINSSSVTKIAGTYRGNPVTHHLDQSTGLNVIVDPSGAFVSGWKLGPEQLTNVLKHGGLS